MILGPRVIRTMHYSFYRIVASYERSVRWNKCRSRHSMRDWWPTGSDTNVVERRATYAPLIPALFNSFLDMVNVSSRILSENLNGKDPSRRRSEPQRRRAFHRRISCELRIAQADPFSSPQIMGATVPQMTSSPHNPLLCERLGARRGGREGWQRCGMTRRVRLQGEGHLRQCLRSSGDED